MRADGGVEARARNRARIAFPWPTYIFAWAIGTLPPALTDRLLNRMPKKAALADDPDAP